MVEFNELCYIELYKEILMEKKTRNMKNVVDWQRTIGDR